MSDKYILTRKRYEKTIEDMAMAFVRAGHGDANEVRRYEKLRNRLINHNEALASKALKELKK